MRRLGGITAAATVLILMALSVSALADDAIDMPEERDVGRVRKKVEALRAWRLTEELNLDAETSARLFPAIREADEQRLALERENRRLVRDLNLELNTADVNQERVDRIIDQLIENRLQQARNEQRHLKHVRDILTPEMAARYIMFQVKFQRELRQLVNERVRERRDRDGPAGPDRSRQNNRSGTRRDGSGFGGDSGSGGTLGPGGGDGGGGRR